MIRFRCNICGNNIYSIGNPDRESLTCPMCGSVSRFRVVIHALSSELFNESYILPDFPTRPDIRGIGISDWEGYAILLSKKLGYINTYYHQEPQLDITNVPEEQKRKYDFVICSDVFEHIVPPVSKGFQGCNDLLKVGGIMIFSVPYGFAEETLEYYPNLHNYKMIEIGGGKYLQNIDVNGKIKIYPNPMFHGGDGATLELRLFSEASLMKDLQQAGFENIKIYRTFSKYGAGWGSSFSQILSARCV